MSFWHKSVVVLGLGKSMIAISLLESDLLRLADEVDKALRAGADFIYIGLLDCHSISNENFGILICKSLRDYGVRCPISVHFGGVVTSQIVQSFSQAGVSRISIDIETSDLHEAVLSVKSVGCSVGLSVEVGTDITEYCNCLKDADYIELKISDSAYWQDPSYLDD